MHQMPEEHSSSGPARSRGSSPADARFSVGEVLQIAEEIERKAAGFHLEAAQRFADEACRGLCRHLAACRTRRQQAWARVRRTYSEPTGGELSPGAASCLENALRHEMVQWGVRAFPRGGIPPAGTPARFTACAPDDYVLAHPWVMAGLTCFAARPGSDGRLTGRETSPQILREALQQSKDLAFFYRGLNDFAAGSEAERMTDYLVHQEERHAGLLSRSLARMHADCPRCG